MVRERRTRMIPRRRLTEEEKLFIMDRGKRYAEERTGYIGGVKRVGMLSEK